MSNINSQENLFRQEALDFSRDSSYGNSLVASNRYQPWLCSGIILITGALLVAIFSIQLEFSRPIKIVKFEKNNLQYLSANTSVNSCQKNCVYYAMLPLGEADTFSNGNSSLTLVDGRNTVPVKYVVHSNEPLKLLNLDGFEVIEIEFVDDEVKGFLISNNFSYLAFYIHNKKTKLIDWLVEGKV